MQVKVYTRDGCPRCVQTKTLLNNSEISFAEVKIGRDIERDDVLAKFPDQRALPIVTVNEVIIPLSEVPVLAKANKYSQ